MKNTQHIFAPHNICAYSPCLEKLWARPHLENESEKGNILSGTQKYSVYIYIHICNILHTQRVCRWLKSFDTLAVSTVRPRYIAQNNCVLLLPVQGTWHNNSKQLKLNIFKFSTNNTNYTSSLKYNSKQTKENFVRCTKYSYCVLRILTVYQRYLLNTKDSCCVQQIVVAYQRWLLHKKDTYCVPQLVTVYKRYLLRTKNSCCVPNYSYCVQKIVHAYQR